MREPIRAAIINSDRCAAEGYAVRAAGPILAMCRKLLAAGYDPDRPLHAHRGGARHSRSARKAAEELNARGNICRREVARNASYSRSGETGLADASNSRPLATSRWP